MKSYAPTFRNTAKIFGITSLYHTVTLLCINYNLSFALCSSAITMLCNLTLPLLPRGGIWNRRSGLGHGPSHFPTFYIKPSAKQRSCDSEKIKPICTGRGLLTNAGDQGCTKNASVKTSLATYLETKLFASFRALKVWMTV